MERRGNPGLTPAQKGVGNTALTLRETTALSSEQHIFLKAWLESGCYKVAALAAGKSSGWGFRELQKDYMLSALHDRDGRALPTKHDRVRLLERIALGVELTTMAGVSKETGEPWEITVPFEGKDRLKAVELLAKMEGDLTIKVEQTVTVQPFRFVAPYDGLGPVPEALKADYIQCECGETVLEKELGEHLDVDCPLVTE